MGPPWYSNTYFCDEEQEPRMSGKRAYWSTRFGFYLAAIGSACGLGNLWRFPFVVEENGGGAFVLIYLLAALTVGLPLLISELMLGKRARKSLIAAALELVNGKSKYSAIITRSAVLLTLVVFSYYAVISGWVVYFLAQFTAGSISQSDSSVNTMFSVLMENGLLQLMLVSAHLLICAVVVSKSIQEGLEKWVSYIMPVFAVLLIFLLVRAASLNSFGSAARFLFYPDFSKLTMASLGHALGHVFFTLSIGFGSMVTFGSYLKEADHIPTAGFRVTVADGLLSLVSALLIFSVVMQSASNHQDTGLLFETLPMFLLQMPGGWFFGVAFFLCLYAAALGASIGLLEVIVSNFMDQKKWSRSYATWFVISIAFLVSFLPALSSSVFKNVQIAGYDLLSFVDAILINWLLPIIVLGVGTIIVKGMSIESQKGLFVDVNRIESASLFGHWRYMVVIVAPLIIALALLLQLFDLVFKNGVL
jgi:neurotransmitter:Na+ symporter, NSS family